MALYVKWFNIVTQMLQLNEQKHQIVRKYFIILKIQMEITNFVSAS